VPNQNWAIEGFSPEVRFLTDCFPITLNNEAELLSPWHGEICDFSSLPSHIKLMDNKPFSLSR
jgi:hypothetical protein